MRQDPGSKSPNDTLADQIVQSLVEAGLISTTHKPQLEAKLKAGGVPQDDWNLWIDVATAPRKAQEEKHG